MQVPVRSQAERDPTATERIAWCAGHQCQPSSFIPVAAFLPMAPIGSGGSGGGRLGGYAGSPPIPAICIHSSARS
jgi:hypothetical protein